MIEIFAVQMPFSVCIVWFFMTILRGPKNHSNWLSIALMGLLTVCFFCYSGHVAPSLKDTRFVFYNIISQFTSLAALPVACIYIRSLFLEDSKESPLVYLLLLIPIIFSGVCLALVFNVGVDRIVSLIARVQNDTLIFDRALPGEQAFAILYFKGYKVLYSLGLLLCYLYLFIKVNSSKFKFHHIPQFVAGKRSSFLGNIICLFLFILFLLMYLVAMLNGILLEHISLWTVFFSFTISFSAFVIGYAAAVPPLPGNYLNLERLKHPFNAMRETRADFIRSLDSGPAADKPAQGYDKILVSFNDLMDKNQCFLEPDMNIEEIARRLSTNRTYVSKLVNIYYEMTFRDYLNKKRVEFSKTLLLDDRDAVIEYVASKSGYLSSTQYIRKFKELEGVTPSVWRNNYVRNQKK